MKLLEIYMVNLLVNSAQYEVIASLFVTVNCNASKDYFSIEAYKNASKLRKSCKNCIFNVAKLLLNRAASNKTLYKLILPTIEIINFSARRYSFLTRRLE